MKTYINFFSIAPGYKVLKILLGYFGKSHLLQIYIFDATIIQQTRGTYIPETLYTKSKVQKIIGCKIRIRTKHLQYLDFHQNIYTFFNFGCSEMCLKDVTVYLYASMSVVLKSILWLNYPSPCLYNPEFLYIIK